MNKNKYKNMMFFAPDEGGGEGGGDISPGAAAFEPATTKTTTGDRPLPEETGAPPSAGPTGAETPPAAPSFDPNKFAQEFGASLSESLKPILQKEPELTPEEARARLKVWEPDDNWFTQYDNLQTRKDAVLAMRDALMEQAHTRMQMQLEEAIGALTGQLQPHLAAFQAAEDRAREARFQGAFPQLNNEKFTPLIKAIVQDLTDRNQKFQSEKELFTAIANGVEAVIKVNNPEFKLESNSSSQETSGRGGRQLPTQTPGGGGGTGRRESTNKEPVKRGLAVFMK